MSSEFKRQRQRNVFKLRNFINAAQKQYEEKVVVEVEEDKYWNSVVIFL